MKQLHALSFRPVRWVAPAAVVMGCLGSLPLWLGADYSQPGPDPDSFAGLLLGDEASAPPAPASLIGTPAAAQPASH